MNSTCLSTACGLFTALTLSALTLPASALETEADVWPFGPGGDQDSNRSANPDDDGRPTRRAGGGSRGEFLDVYASGDPCLMDMISLESSEGVIEAQLDENGETVCSNSTVSVAETGLSRLRIWVYFPNFNFDQSIPELPLLIGLDDGEQPVAAPWIVNVTAPWGIQCFELPYTLERNTVYTWRLEALLTESPADNPMLEGLVQYMPSTTNSWKDRLTELGEQVITAPDEANRAQWKMHLQSQGLNAIADILPSKTCQLLESQSEPVPN
ncbi:MAG: hypothetical protein AAGI69_28985 [Cyanobacteria bacterium P01_H01_bin.21]